MFEIASDAVWQARPTFVRVAGAVRNRGGTIRAKENTPQPSKGESANAYIRGSSRSQRVVSMAKERGFEHLPWVSLVIPL
jgi:uncharacterized lipoprotein YddW (UPF0748 family)